MELFIKIIRWAFYILAFATIVLFILYKSSNPVDEDLFDYFVYCGLCAIGLSAIRFVLKFVY